MLFTSKDHLSFVSISVVGEVEALVRVEHVQELFVVLDTLGGGVHVARHILLHGFEDGHDLLMEMGEFLALVVEGVELDGVVQVLLNAERLSHSIHNLHWRQVWELGQQLLNITLWSRKGHEFL